VIVVLDDHLLRDWIVGADDALVDAVAGDEMATTNLWYARLCRSAARAGDGALLQGWSPERRRVLIAGLVTLPDHIVVLPMRSLAWKMAELAADHPGLSALGTEAVAATIELDGRLLVSARDDGPGIRRCCASLGLSYHALAR
jgi:hypothetical protein